MQSYKVQETLVLRSHAKDLFPQTFCFRHSTAPSIYRLCFALYPNRLFAPSLIKLFCINNDRKANFNITN